jgi:hypothetical protein
MPRSTAQLKIDKFFKTTTLAYQPGLVRIFGAVSGLFLYQLLYWTGKAANKDGWIFKTVKDFEKETGLSRSNQETAVKNLVKAGVIEHKLAQVPAKRHFRVNVVKLENMIPELMQKYGLVYLKPPIQIAEIANSRLLESSDLLHEITQETTTKNTGNAGIFDNDSFKRERDKLRKKMNLVGIISNDFDNKEYCDEQ